MLSLILFRLVDSTCLFVTPGSCCWKEAGKEMHDSVQFAQTLTSLYFEATDERIPLYLFDHTEKCSTTVC